MVIKLRNIKITYEDNAKHRYNATKEKKERKKACAKGKEITYK